MSKGGPHGEPRVAIAVHGGAGRLLRARPGPSTNVRAGGRSNELLAETPRAAASPDVAGGLSQEQQAHYHSELRRALEAGHAVLAQSGSSLDAVVAAVALLEDSPGFNAGRGSVLNHEGHVEMDACIMHGQGLRSGAVAGVRGVRNPVLAAREVMNSPYVLLAGSGAESFAQERNLRMETPEYFVTASRLSQWRRLVGEPVADDELPAAEQDGHEFGTVGAVALDAHGDLAAATSTGGLANKRWGRVGDSPIVGAGTYADNRSAAVSATGQGEAFLRIAAAHDICARVRYLGVTLTEAVRAVIDGELAAVGASGGVIAMDRDGNVVFGMNDLGMFRGSIDVHGVVTTAIYADE